MTEPRDPRPARPRQPSRPDADRPSIEVDRTVGGATEQRRFDLPKRSATLTGLQAPMPLRPEPNPLEKKTWRLPAPPSALAHARRTPIPPSDGPPAGETAAAGQLAAVLAERDRLQDELAKAQRDARAGAEAQLQTYPPKVTPQRSPSPIPSSTPAKVDQALGMTVRHLLARAAPFLLAAAGIGGGVTAVAKPSADPAKTDAVLASQEAMRADVALIREQMAGVLKREAARDQYTLCLEEVLDDMGEQVLPAQDRLGSAAPLRAYIKQRCRRLRP
jgi:hypothetical protein